MKKSKDSKYVYIAMCIVFVIALIVVALSLSYAFFKGDVEGYFGETKMQTNTYDDGIETSLSDDNKINAFNIYPIDESEVNTLAPSLEFTARSTNEDGSKFDIYLKDISISSNFVNSSFKWQLLMDGAMLASGDFSDIATKGTNSTTKTSTESMKYFDNYYLKSSATFDGNNESEFVFRVYLLNDNSNQNALMNGTFSGKVAIENYK